MSAPSTSSEVAANNTASAIPPSIQISPFATRLSLVKDVVGVVQNLAAIVALIAGAVWFVVQRPFSPVIKPTTTVKVVPMKDSYQIDALALFENTGHVPLHYSCEGMKIAPDDEKMPTPVCDHAHILKPGEQVTVGMVTNIPSGINQTYFLYAVLGERNKNGDWSDSAVEVERAILLQPDTRDGAIP